MVQFTESSSWELLSLWFQRIHVTIHRPLHTRVTNNIYNFLLLLGMWCACDEHVL